MKIVDTKTHGYLDYLVALILVTLPWFLGFYAGGRESWVPVLLGVILALYSSLTNYELGIVKVLGMRLHIGLDLGIGTLLTTSPWLFGFREEVYRPHVILGLSFVVLALITDKVSHRGNPEGPLPID